MRDIFTNFAESIIADVGGIGVDAVEFTVDGGHGALFPAPGADEMFRIVCVTAAGAREVMYVTDVSADTFTVVRAREGTTALVFEENDRVFHRVTAGMLDEFMQDASQCVFVNNANGNPNMSDSRFSITPAGVTVSTVQTVGPTGSGADHTWLALNDVPEDVDWIEVSCYIGRDGNNDNLNDNYIAVHLSLDGSDLTDDDYICRLNWVNVTTYLNDVYIDARGTKKIPVADRVFAAYWAGEIDTGFTYRATLTLIGYGYNS